MPPPWQAASLPPHKSTIHATYHRRRRYQLPAAVVVVASRFPSDPEQRDNLPLSSVTSVEKAIMLDYVWFKFVRFLYKFTDFFLRVIFRYSLSKGWSSDRKKGSEYENSAHVTRVVMKGRKIELEGARINNFILR
jgi:hypothetical protein